MAVAGDPLFEICATRLEAQMVWIDARWVIAAMCYVHAFWDFLALDKFIHQAVSRNVLAADGRSAVAVAVTESLPFPATTRHASAAANGFRWTAASYSVGGSLDQLSSMANGSLVRSGFGSTVCQDKQHNPGERYAEIQAAKAETPPGQMWAHDVAHEDSIEAGEQTDEDRYEIS